MKLTFFIPDLKGGGAQRMIINMANEFAAQGHKVDLVLVQNNGKYHELVSKKVNVIDLGKTRALFSIFALTQYIKTAKPDILLSALFYVNVIAVLAKRLAPSAKTKIIVTERNHISLKAQNSTSWADRAAPWIVRLAYPLADAVVGISAGVAQDVQNCMNAPPDKISWIHNPVVTNDLLENLKETAQDEWFESSKNPVIVMSGRLVVQKDYETAFRAFKQVLEKQELRLLILGEGELKNKLKKLAQDLDIEKNINFKGFVENPLSYMKRADLFLLSSRHEGFGNVVVEALLCGLPVVSTDCPAGPAEILKGGEFGTLAPVSDPDAMAKAILETLAAPRTPEKQKARAMCFTVEKICAEYEALFKKLMVEET
jgi:glycosyltransferase involved in cell wall biosynthesis